MVTWRRAVWAGWLIASIAITGLTQACIPATKKLTGPLACPSGTEHYVVHRYMKRGSDNKSSDTSDLVCIDADGGGSRANAFRTFGVGLGFTCLFLLGPALALARAPRTSRRGPSAKEAAS